MGAPGIRFGKYRVLRRLQAGKTGRDSEKDSWRAIYRRSQRRAHSPPRTTLTAALDLVLSRSEERLERGVVRFPRCSFGTFLQRAAGASIQILGPS